MPDVHIGETAVVRIKNLYDAQGNETDTWDRVAGVQYALTHPDSMSVDDDDAEPKDATLTFTALTPTGEDAFVDITLDGAQGDAVRQFTLRNQDDPIHVVPGEAVSGTVEIVVTPVTP